MTCFGRSFSFSEQSFQPCDIFAADDFQKIQAAPQDDGIYRRPKSGLGQVGNCPKSGKTGGRGKCRNGEGELFSGNSQKPAQTQRKVQQMGHKEAYKVSVHPITGQE